jgi:capsular exopolysaccharide synthesis family protein
MSRNYEVLRRANKEQELFQRIGRSADIKQDSLPISAVLADKVQNRLATHDESVDTLKDISQASDSRKVPVHRKQPRLDLQALCREEEIKLIQRVFLPPGTGAPRVVVFSGMGHGTGCSSICGRAGETLAAHVAGTICVVDANLRSPFLHRYLGICNRAGLVEALVQSDPIRHFTQRTSKGNLWVLTSGLDISNPHALLTLDRLRPRIAELRSEFDHVLIDTPPVNYFADARLVGQLADGIVLIVEANSTRREAVLKTKESLQAANLRLLAAVLNKRTFPIPDYLYRKL